MKMYVRRCMYVCMYNVGVPESENIKTKLSSHIIDLQLLQIELS